jgi:hypothetical protein
MALHQEMHEHRKRLGLEGAHHTGPPQLPAVDIQFALAKHKDHEKNGVGEHFLDTQPANL